MRIIQLSGDLSLRNDNPSNIVFGKNKTETALNQKEQGNLYFKSQEFLKAVKLYNEALKRTEVRSL